MTSHRQDGGANDSEPEGKDLDVLREEDDGQPLLPLLDAEAGPARPLAEGELLLLADRIERQFAQRRRPVGRLTPRRLLLAGGLFAASAAAAVVGVTVAQRSADPVPTTSPAEQRVPPPVVAVPPATLPPMAPVAPTAPAEVAPEERVPQRLHGAGDRPVEPGSANQPGGVSPAPDVSQSGANVRPRTARESSTVASDRLAAANSLRSRHRYREALALYLQVIEMAPSGMQASVARVAAAEMQLDHFGDVAGAERLYRDAKTHGGELTTEAQFGLAQVARARADAPGERRALQDFLSRHPESPLGAAARRRLNTLGELNTPGEK